MIPATKPLVIPAVPKAEYPLWTVRRVQIDYLRPGAAAAIIDVNRSRDIGDGNTELAPVPGETLTIPDIYAEANDDYPTEVRSAVLQAVGGVVGAVAALMTAREIR
jgi:hypothetical protein